MALAGEIWLCRTRATAAAPSGRKILAAREGYPAIEPSNKIHAAVSGGMLWLIRNLLCGS